MTWLLVLSILAFGLGVIALSGSAAAQSIPENSTVDGERVDQNTIITDKSYNSDTGEVTLSIYSESVQRIAVYDGGALFKDKEIERSSTLTRAGDHINLTVSATKVDGAIAVGLQTDQTNRGVVVEEENFLFRGPWSSTDAQITGLAGLLSGLIVVTAAAYKRTNTRSPEPEREL